MRLTFKNADWKRVLRFYSFYALVVILLAWPFCLPLGRCDVPFEWLWVPYLAGSSTARFVMVVGFEFYVSLMVAICVRFKEQQTDESPDTDNTEFLSKIGVVIPCHKSGSVIGDTLELALHHFAPQNIVVMDNGRSDTPMDNCLEEVRKISPDITYKWVPVGHKAVALMLGSRLLPPTVEYLLLIDDDVLIPRTMRFDPSYFEDKAVSAVAYSIGGCGPDNTPDSMNMIQRFQDFEFKLADTYRCFASQYSTIMFAHGAVGLWRRSRFNEIYSKHPGLPIGEDGWAGRLNLLSGYEMKQDSGPIIRTEVPPDLIPRSWWYWSVECCDKCKPQTDEEQPDGEPAVVAGYGSPDLFNQRARRWDMNSPRRIMCHTKLFFTYGWNQYRKLPFHRALIFNLVFRLGVLRGAWTLFGALIYVSYLARVIYSSDPLWVVVLLLVLYALQVFKYVVVNYCVWRRRPDLRVSLKTMCFMPLYRKVMVLYRCYGYFRSVLKYVPIVKTPEKPLGEREDLAQVWPTVRDQTDQDLIVTEAEAELVEIDLKEATIVEPPPLVAKTVALDIPNGADEWTSDDDERPDLTEESSSTNSDDDDDISIPEAHPLIPTLYVTERLIRRRNPPLFQIEV